MATLQTQDTTIGVGDGATAEAFTAVGEVKSINISSDGASEIETTNLSSTAREFNIGLKGSFSVGLDCNYDPNDAQQTALETLYGNQNLNNFRITFSDSSTFTFAGYVQDWAPTIEMDSVVALSVNIRASGTWTIA